MKKSCGIPDMPCVIPKPCYLIGCYDGKTKTSFVTVTNLSGGWSGNVPVLIICVNSGYTQKIIEQQGIFSANMAGLDMIDQVNFCGFNSSKDVDKGAKIPHTCGKKLSVPIVDASPIAFECSVMKTIELESVKVFIAKIENFLITESKFNNFPGILSGNTLDASKLDPIVSCLDGYYKLGEKIDVCRKE